MSGIKELEEALKNRKTYPVSIRFANNETIQKAAQSYLHYLKHEKPLIDALLEARAKATAGEWYISKITPAHIRGEDKTIICRTDSAFQPEDENEILNNSQFITTAANIAAELIKEREDD